MEDGGILVQKDPAKDLDLQVGDPLDVTFQNGTVLTLPVAGIYDDASIAGNWLISIDTLAKASPLDDAATSSSPPSSPTGVTAEQGDQAVRAAMAPFPQAKVETNAEFRKSQEGQIDQLLIVITVLLGFSIIIAVLGISITLALGVFERTREIGLMRAVGMNRAPDPAGGPLGGDHRVHVRRDRRHRRRHVDRHRPVDGGARHGRSTTSPSRRSRSSSS